MSAERLQKLLARAGVASRRHAETLIRDGRVRVDGRVVTELGTRADPGSQRIELDGRPLASPQESTTLLLNKPRGYITTAVDPQGRPTVLDLLPAGPRLFPVGRLDMDSEGLLLLTDDGDLAYRLTHPRFGLAKEYHVWTAEPLPDQLGALAEGVMLEDGPTAPAVARRLGATAEGVVVALTLHEGRNRQVRRMFAAVDLPVYRLRRVRVGPLRLGALEPGAWRRLDTQTVASIRRSLAGPVHGTER